MVDNLIIRKSYIEHIDNQSRLCADMEINKHIATLWFSVETEQERYLSINRADPFVIALLPLAMRKKYNIICEDEMSDRLHYQLRTGLIPVLEQATSSYNPIEIKAQPTKQKYKNIGAVGTGFSGGIDCLYTIYSHDKRCQYPLTHIAVFNSGVFEGPQAEQQFFRSCDSAKKFAKETNLSCVFVNTNFNEILPERFLDVYSFRNLSCALALQGLFSVYLLSSGHDISNFSIDEHNSASFDPLTVSHIQTENMSFYLSGMEKKRYRKLEELIKWNVSYKWLHPCIYGYAGIKNCGHCKKCSRDITTLYALGALDKYAEVFDVNDFQLNKDLRIGFVLANSENHLYAETLKLMHDNKIEIPKRAYLFEQQFRKAILNLSLKSNILQKEKKDTDND